jgi:Mn-dependent DtxR family transcriptional regulator
MISEIVRKALPGRLDRIASTLGLDVDQVLNALYRLRAKGLVRHEGRGKWTRTRKRS